ncbi:MAG: 2-polyprenyl-3-methyl-5-hydroxy-6-metoxy-1,4-benzoquinol methylase [Bradymonadia bacterium]|jgi:2-polyprenyl-3-methyl-5-hydroxy-6-metoxy-1,4-benzoquinol methylase
MTVLIRLARLHARASVLAHRALGATDGFVAGVLDGALSIEQKSKLGVDLYDAAPHYRDCGTLFDWEERWFDRRLHGAKRVLVGACGAGREVCALLERGQRVSGFEPAESLLELAKARAPRAELWRDAYESWSSSAQADHYDAVLLGWGSLSHVLSPDERIRLLTECVRVCPTGPILVSYWPRTTNPAAARARQLGATLGGALGDGLVLGDAYRANIGFIHMFAKEELKELATHVGRQLVIEGGPSDYSHATFLPPS